jgi:SAM-dependent methyltransferase
MGRSRSLPAAGRRLVKMLGVLRADGLRETVVLARGYVEYRRERRFGARVDKRHGSETGGFIPLRRLEIESPNIAEGVQYEPVSELYFHRMLRSVSLPPDTYVFVDLGSGKGRALLLATQYPFRRIVGVDFSPELNEIARRNVARLPSEGRPRPDIEIVLGDATQFEFPREPLAVFLYNPFGERVLATVVERLGASLREAPRPLFVFYKNPLHRRVFDEAPFLRLVKGTSQYAVYAGTAVAS